VVPLPPGETPFTVQLNNNNNKRLSSRIREIHNKEGGKYRLEKGDVLKRSKETKEGDVEIKRRTQKG
jgi:hypothetical protein